MINSLKERVKSCLFWIAVSPLAIPWFFAAIFIPGFVGKPTMSKKQAREVGRRFCPKGFEESDEINIVVDYEIFTTKDKP
jgi:hypothetical protein